MAEIKVLKTERSECIEDAINTLETALQEAREGRVVAVAVAVIRPDGAGNGAFSQTDDVMRLLGSMSMLQHRLLMAAEAEPNPHR